MNSVGIGELVIWILFVLGAFASMVAYANNTEILPLVALAIYPLTGLIIFLTRGSALHPLRWFALTWLVAFMPQTTQIIKFEGLPKETSGILYLIGFLITYSIGYLISALTNSSRNNANYDRKMVLDSTVSVMDMKVLEYARIFAIFGISGSLLFSIELIFVTGVFSSGGLLDVREMYVERTTTALAQVASLLSWGSFFSLVSLIVFWERLRPFDRATLATAVAGFFLYSLLSAGRQAAFQLAFFLLCALLIKNHRMRVMPSERTDMRSAKLIGAVIFAILVMYMMIVAVLRHEYGSTVTKTDVLLQLFGAYYSEPAQAILEIIPQTIADAATETIIYVTSPVAIFVSSFDLEVPKAFWGLFNFPYIARRLEGVTGISVLDAMNYRRILWQSAGLMSHGWSTAITSLIFDFGKFGALVVGFMLGAGSAFVYNVYCSQPSLAVGNLLTAINVGTVYQIMFPAWSDTNFLLYFLVALIWFTYSTVRFGRG